MTTIWTPLFSFVVFVVVFALGDIVAEKTKGLISAIIVGCFVYLVGFWTGIIPATSVADSTLPGMMSAFGIAVLLVNLGTILDLESLLREWKTVVIALILSLIHIFCESAGTQAEDARTMKDYYRSLQK